MLKCDNRRCIYGVGLEAITGSAWQTAGNVKSGSISGFKDARNLIECNVQSNVISGEYLISCLRFGS